MENYHNQISWAVCLFGVHSVISVTCTTTEYRTTPINQQIGRSNKQCSRAADWNFANWIYRPSAQCRLWLGAAKESIRLAQWIFEIYSSNARPTSVAVDKIVTINFLDLFAVEVQPTSGRVTVRTAFIRVEIGQYVFYVNVRASFPRISLKRKSDNYTKTFENRPYARGFFFFDKFVRSSSVKNALFYYYFFV